MNAPIPAGASEKKGLGETQNRDLLEAYGALQILRESFFKDDISKFLENSQGVLAGDVVADLTERIQASLQTPTLFLTKHTFHDPEKENAAPGNPLWAHTSKRPAGLYLQMWHGRKTKDEELDDWGLIGPTIGPIQSIHFTYAATMNLTFVDGEDTGPLTSTDALRFEEDYLFYDGIFYGDWSVTLIN